MFFSTRGRSCRPLFFRSCFFAPFFYGALCLAQNFSPVLTPPPTGEVAKPIHQTLSAPTPATVTLSPAPKTNPDARDFKLAQIPGVDITSADVHDGPRFENFESYLKKIYPHATSIKEAEFVPFEQGGTSLLGLVGRLLGDSPQRDNEGLRSRRFIYHVFEDEKTVALVHGSSNGEGSDAFSVFVYYSPSGVIQQIETSGIPAEAEKSLESGSYLKQFVGHATEDFEVELGKRGRIKSRGIFFNQARRPSSGAARSYFDRILRSVRFNASFMDVSYFITQHPDLADQPRQEFPQTIQVTTQQPKTGPEAFARGKDNAASPIDGKPFLLQDLKSQPSSQAN